MDVKIVLPDILASKKCEFYHQEQYLENYKELLFCVHCRFSIIHCMFSIDHCRFPLFIHVNLCPLSIVFCIFFGFPLWFISFICMFLDFHYSLSVFNSYMLVLSVFLCPLLVLHYPLPVFHFTLLVLHCFLLLFYISNNCSLLDFHCPL